MEGRILDKLQGLGEESKGSSEEGSCGRQAGGFQDVSTMNGVGHGASYRMRFPIFGIGPLLSDASFQQTLLALLSR
jgi:hypothetical protein